MGTRREEVLSTLRAAAAPMSIVDVAKRLSIHPNTARFHLETLAKQGRVEAIKPSRPKPGRPPRMFRAAPGMDPDGPRDYRMLAAVFADAFARQRNPQDKAIEAGRVWGRNAAATSEPGAARSSQRALDRLTGLLADLDFAPEIRSAETDSDEIGLRNCPFLELTDNRRDVICPVHLGLMQGALETWNAPFTVNALAPFVEPDLCIATLTPKGRAS